MSASKIEVKKVQELFTQVNFLLDGIRETVRTGGDVLHLIDNQAEEIQKIFMLFQVTYMSAPEALVILDKDKKYLDTANRLMSDPNFSEFNCGAGERKAILQTKIYNWLKREIRTRKDMPGIEATRQEIFFYVDDILCSWELYSQMEKVAFYSMSSVLDDIVSEIMEHRKRNPQQQLFL